MRAVSDTSPISALAWIGRLSLLKSQFSEILIPAAVTEELKSHPDAAALSSIEVAIQERWIRPMPSPQTHLLSILISQLHRGEAESIALAADIRADAVLIDEQEGRRFAVQAGLSVTGVLGVLLRAKFDGEIALLKPEIRALRTKARFFVTSSLEAKLLSAAGE